ncbi:SAP domain-containing protein [Macrococcoides bohemicum]|uniref:SAP domain-containing protein n=1 Tax=Macrococcoides bohemicum TaxID=1903056 RepID=UPI003AFFF8E9
MKRLNAMEVLVLHFTDGKVIDNCLYESFWYDRFSTNPAPIKQKLIKQGILIISKDTKKSLNKLKLDDLKNILRNNSLKVGGKKAELIDRILESEIILENEVLPQVYEVVPAYRKILEDTTFLKSIIGNQSLDFIKAYEFYLKHPNLNSDTYLENIYMENIKKEIKKEHYGNAPVLYSYLSHHYFNKKDEKSGIFNLNSHIMLRLLNDVNRIIEYKRAGYDEFIDRHNFYIHNDDIQKYRVLLKTEQITEHQLYNDLIESVSMIDEDKKNKEIMATYILNKIANKGNENEVAIKDILNRAKKPTSNTNQKTTPSQRPAPNNYQDKNEIIIKSDNTPVKKEQKGLFSKLKNKFLK